MSVAAIEARAAAEGLALLGGLHPGPADGAPEGAGTLFLLGPAGPRWEAAFAAAPESRDGEPHPIDRWSRRVIGALAVETGASAVFPFDGPPWPPVLAWARATGRAFVSPIGPIVHAEAGLWFSVRGVLALPGRHALPPPVPRPCDACPDQPCRSACPVGAFTGTGYDVPACAAHLAGAGRSTCLAAGCAARHACPAGSAFRPLPEQAARHMRAFLAGISPDLSRRTGDKSVDKPESG